MTHRRIQRFLFWGIQSWWETKILPEGLVGHQIPMALPFLFLDCVTFQTGALMILAKGIQSVPELCIDVGGL